jgi:hypothetical protein
MACSLGFSGKAVIHPKFVPGTNQAFTPTEAQVHPMFWRDRHGQAGPRKFACNSLSKASPYSI